MPYVDPQHKRQRPTTTPTPSSGARGKRSEQGYAAASAALSPSPPREEEGWLGWLGRKADAAGDWVGEQTSGAGEWIGEQASAAGDWASETAGNVRDWTTETAGEVRDWTVETAGEVREYVSETAEQVGSAWETAANTDVSIDRRGMGVSMRMADLRKMLPPEAAEQIRFDEQRLDDRISARYEYGTDYVTLTAPALSLAALSIQGFHTGAANATDVTVTISNPGGKIPFVQDGWQDSGNLLMDVHVGQARAENIRYGQGPGGMTAQSLEVQGLAVSGGAPTARIIGGGGAGTMSGGFTVDRAVIRGASAGGAQIGEVGVSGANASWRDDTGQVRAGASEITVSDVGAMGAGVQSGRATGFELNATGGVGNATASTVGFDGLSLGENETIGSGSVDGVTAAWNADTGSVTAGAERAGVQNLALQQTSLASAEGRGMTVNMTQLQNGRSRLNVGAQSVQGSDLAVGDDVSIAGIEGAGVTFRNDTDAGTQGATAASLTTRGVGGEQFQAGQISSENVTYSLDDRSGELGVGASSIVGNDLSAAGITAEQARILGARYTNNVETGVGTSQARSLNVDAIGSQYGSAANLTGSGVTLTHGPNRFGAQVEQTSVTDIASQYGSASSVSARGLGLNVGENASDARIDELTGADLTSQYGSLAALEARGLRGSTSTVDGVRQAQGGMTSIVGTDLRAGDASAAQLSAHQLTAGLNGGVMNGSVGRAQARQLAYGELGNADSASLSGLEFSKGDDATTASLAGLGVRGAGLRYGSANATMDAANLTGGSWSQRGDTQTMELQRGTVTGLAGHYDGQGGPPISIPGVDWSGHQIDANLGLGAGTVNLGSSRDMVRDAGALVDNASINVGLPLNAAEYGPVRVERGTRVDGQVNVRDGQLVPGQTGVRMNRPLDGPLWTTVKGVHLDPGGRRHPDQGKLRADVGGFFDQNISQDVMEVIGGDGKRVPLSVAELSRLGSNQLPDAENTGQVTLAREQATDNQFDLRSNGEGAVASFVRMLVSSMRVQVGSTEASAGRTAVSGASVQTTGAPNQPDAVTGSIQSLEIERLRTVTTGE